jgi:hypothetical protein
MQRQRKGSGERESYAPLASALNGVLFPHVDDISTAISAWLPAWEMVG